MPTERGGIATAVANGKIYVFGGEAPEKTFDNTEVYEQTMILGQLAPQLLLQDTAWQRLQ